MYRMVVLDIDGTCVDSQGQVRPRVREAVSRARQAGVLVTLATGRRLRAALPVARTLGIELPLVLHNGAQIYDPVREESWYSRPLSRAVTDRAIRFLRGNGLPVVVITDETHGPDIYYEGWPASPEVQDILRRHGQAARRTGDLVHELCGQTLKLFTFDYKARVAPAAGNLTARVPGQYSWIAVPDDRPGHLYLELWAPDCNKWTGIERLARHYGVQPGEIIAFGDSLNDLEMLRHAGLGVAMANGQPEALAAADLVTASNDEDGVAAVLERHVLEVA